MRITFRMIGQSWTDPVKRVCPCHKGVTPITPSLTDHFGTDLIKKFCIGLSIIDRSHHCLTGQLLQKIWKSEDKKSTEKMGSNSKSARL